MQDELYHGSAPLSTFFLTCAVAHLIMPIRRARNLMLDKAIEVDNSRGVYRVQVLERVFTVLDALAQARGDASVPELAKLTQLHRSTLHRLLIVLAGYRFVEKTSAGRYRLGSRLLELGTFVAAKFDVPRLAKPYLEQIVDATNETAHMGVLRQGEVVSITNVACRRTLSAPATVGRRSPVHCSALGKCILSGLPYSAVRDIIRSKGLRAYTPNTITSLKALMIELRHVQKCGYAIDDEEYEEGLKCIGAPVRDHSGRIVAAISIAGPATRLNELRMPSLSASVMRGARQLSAALGFVEVCT